MKDLLDFLLVPVRRAPWSVATVFGVVLGLPLVAQNVVAMLGLGTAASRTGFGVTVCFAAGLVGASRGREFYHGILAAFAAILIANVIGLASGMFAIRAATIPIGTFGAGVGAWLSHRHAVA